jgi:hypothetical protein
MPANKPSPTAISALRDSPWRAYEFDEKYGPGASQRALNGNGDELADLLKELIKETRKNGCLLDELVDHVCSAKRVIKDDDGEIIGVEAVDDDELDALRTDGSLLRADDN